MSARQTLRGDRKMSEQDIINNTLSLNTIDTMCRDLARLGISEGETLLVHSSLSSLGWVCGGPQAVVSALRKAVGGQGTLVMPAHSGDWSDPAEWEKPPVPKEWLQVIYDNMPAYEPEITPTRGMGRIAELFRTYPGHNPVRPSTGIFLCKRKACRSDYGRSPTYPANGNGFAFRQIICFEGQDSVAGSRL